MTFQLSQRPAEVAKQAYTDAVLSRRTSYQAFPKLPTHKNGEQIKWLLFGATQLWAFGSTGQWEEVSCYMLGHSLMLFMKLTTTLQ